MEMILLEECCEILDSMRVPITAANREEGPYPYYGANGIQDYVAEYIFDDELVLLAEDGGNFGSKTRPIAYRVSGKCWVNNHAHVLKPQSGLDADYLCYSLMFYNTDGLVNGATRQKLTQATMRKMQIPKRTLEEQIDIVEKLNKVVFIKNMRQQEIHKLDNLTKARFVELFGDPEFNTFGWDTEELGTLCDVGSSKRIYQNEQSQEGVPFWRISDLISKMDTGVADSGLFIPEERYVELKNAGLVPTTGDILVTSRGTLGRCYIIKDEDKFYFQDGMISWLSSYVDGITPLYLQYLFTMPGFRKQIDGMQAGSTVAYLSIAMLKKLRVMVPPIETQNCFALFVEQLDKSKVVVQKVLENKIDSDMINTVTAETVELLRGNINFIRNGEH